MNDQIFTVCTPNILKQVGEKLLKRLCIILFKVPKLITENNEKLEPIQKYHYYSLKGGH